MKKGKMILEKSMCILTAFAIVLSPNSVYGAKNQKISSSNLKQKVILSTPGYKDDTPQGMCFDKKNNIIYAAKNTEKGTCIYEIKDVLGAPEKNVVNSDIQIGHANGLEYLNGYIYSAGSGDQYIYKFKPGKSEITKYEIKSDKKFHTDDYRNAKAITYVGKVDKKESFIVCTGKANKGKYFKYIVGYFGKDKFVPTYFFKVENPTFKDDNNPGYIGFQDICYQNNKLYICVCNANGKDKDCPKKNMLICADLQMKNIGSTTIIVPKLQYSLNGTGDSRYEMESLCFIGKNLITYFNLPGHDDPLYAYENFLK